MSSGKVAVLGVGLIGGSLGMGLRKRGLASEVVGVGRNPDRLALAERLGAVDAWSTDPASVAGCDWVFICTAVGAIEKMMKEIAPHLDDDALVTDVGSVKRSVMAAAERSLPGRVRFVGGHPIAGSHLSGVTAASADLFCGAVCVLTSGKGSRGAEDELARLWEALGSCVLRMSAEEHDAALAVTSHAPHVVAAALAAAFGKASAARPVLRELVAGGFRDTTRIAASSPELWLDIFLQNSDEVLKACSGVSAELAALEEALRAGDRKRLARLLDAAFRARNSIDEP